MKKGKPTVFKKPEKLNLLINLRITGFSQVSLAHFFNVDRAALIYHFRKYGISNPEVIYDIPRIVKSSAPKNDSVWIDLGDRRINAGRTYQEYLDIYSHRKEGHSV